jgi:hypothetical protein
LPVDALNEQKAFDERSAGILEDLAGEIETGSERDSSLSVSLTAPRAEMDHPSHLDLLQGIDSLVSSLAKQIDHDFVQQAARVK